MSRIGKKPVPVAAGVKLAINGKKISFEGKQGKLELVVHPLIDVKIDDATKEVVVTRRGDDKQDKALHGLTRALINNCILGVATGYKKVLELRGVGYKAELKGKTLVLSVGLANQLTVEVPSNLAVTVEPGQGEITNRVNVSGPDKQAVGNFAAAVRMLRKPEPYKGKGIRYEGEAVKIKPGKQFAGAGAK
jgi:large subunit ribosomal protein L6